MTQQDSRLQTQLRDAQSLYQQLLERSERDRSDQHLLTKTLAALQNALEELQITVEEQQAQNEALQLLSQEREHERQRYQNLFELAPDASFVTDGNGVILAANLAAATLLHRSADYIIGKPLIVLVEHADHAAIYQQTVSAREAIAETTRAGAMRLVHDQPIQLKTTSGAVIPAAFALTAERTMAGDCRLYWAFRDQWERKQLEADDQTTLTERDAAHARLTQLNLELEEQVASKLAIAGDGAQAVEQAQARRPAVILMDIQMPDTDGLEAIRMIRQMPEACDVPIIAVTALAMTGDREQCLAAGADEYLSKPVRLKQLHEIAAVFFEKLIWFGTGVADAGFSTTALIPKAHELGFEVLMSLFCNRRPANDPAVKTTSQRSEQIPLKRP